MNYEAVGFGGQNVDNRIMEIIFMRVGRHFHIWYLLII